MYDVMATNMEKKENSVRTLKITTRYTGFGLVNVIQPPLNNWLDDNGFDPGTLEWHGSGQSKQETGGTNNSGNHGVVNYNYYNTHYQNSMDLSSFGGDKHQNNYGHEGGTTNSEVQNTKQNLLQTGLSAITQLIPLLADSKTETYQNSDRVQVDKSGNTTLVSQAAVGRHVVTKPRPRYNVSSAADMESDGGPSTNRFYPIKLHVPWKTTQPQGTYWMIRLPQALGEHGGVFTQMASRHSILKCGFDVVLMVNSTRFHGGCLGVFLVPEFTQKANVTGFDTKEPEANITLDETIPLQQLFLYPHQLLNPRTNSSVTISVPYCNFAPATDPVTHSTWTILVVVLSRLTLVTGATPNLTLQLNVRPTEAVFHGLRYASTFQGPFPIKLTQNSLQWVTTTPGSSDPVYGPCVAPTADHMPLEIKDTLQLMNIPTLCGPVDGTELGIITLKADHTDVKYHVDVSLSSRFVINTALEAYSRPFAQYRGGIDINMVFVGNQMQNVRYMVAYTPPGVAPPDTQEQAMNCEYVIYDTGLNTSLKFTVPYISTTDFRYVNSGAPNDVTVAGYVSFFQVTDLAVPVGSPTTAQVLVFASASDDFSVKHFSHSSFNYQGNEEPIEPGETGVSKKGDQTLQATSPLPTAPSNSNISYMADRWAIMEVVKVENNDGAIVELSLKNLGKYSNLLDDLGCLYLRADLEISMKVLNEDAMAGNVGIYAAFIPPGASNPGGATTFTGPRGQNTVNLPSILLYTGCPVIKLTTGWTSMSIPYTSPLSAIPRRYSGYANYTGGAWGEPPAATWGHLNLRATTGSHQVLVYYRFKNFRGWLPSCRKAVPLPNRGRSKDPDLVCTTGATNYDLLKLSGDVEENPGPNIWSKLGALNKLAELVPNEADCEKLVTWFQTLKDKWDTLTSDTNELVWKILKWLVMAMCAFKAGPWGKVLLAMHCGGSFIKKLFNIVVDKFKKTFKTEPPKISQKVVDLAKQYLNKERPYQETSEFPPPPEMDENGYLEENNPFSEGNLTIIDKILDWFKPKFQGPLQDLVSVGSLLRHGEWLFRTINYFVGWLKTWIKKERDAGFDKFCTDYEDLPEIMKTLKKAPKHSTDWHEARSWLADLKLRAEKLNVEKEFKIPDVPNIPCSIRPEPVVIVLRGAPGQGKSVSAVLLAQQLSHRLGGNGSFYGYSAATKHFDGYAGQPVVVFDDAGQCTDGVDFQFFCQMVSAAPWTPPMADLSQKGILFTSPVIIMTTNMADFRPNTLADHSAIDRRLTLELDVTARLCKKTRCGSVLDLPQALDGTPEQWPIWTTAVAFHERTAGGRAINNVTKTVTLKRLIDRVMEEVEKKAMIADKLMLEHAVDLGALNFQGPASPVPTPAPRKKEVQRRKLDWLRILDVATQIVTILTMLMTGFSLLKLIFQGPYDGQPVKKNYGKKKVELVDLRYHGPYCQDLEMSLRRKSMIVVQCKRYDGREFQTNMLAIKGRLVLWNYHLFDMSEYIKIDGEWCSLDQLHSVRVSSDGNCTDLVCTRLPPGRPFQDLTKYLTNDSPRYGAQLIGICKSLDLNFTGTLTTHRDTVNITGFQTTHDVYSYRAATGPGYCGSPVFCQVGSSRYIIGMHCAGGSEVGVASRLTKTMVENLIEYFQGYDYQGIIKDKESFPLLYTPAKTTFYPTPAHDNYTTMQPAVLSQRDPRLGEGVVLKEAIFRKHTGNNNLTPTWMIEGARAYAAIVKAKCGYVADTLSLGEALRGIEGLDPMDMTKSPGFPYIAAGQRRTDVLKDYGEKIEMDNVLYAEILKFLSGDFKDHIFTTFLKDELRPDEKVKAGATRVIDIASFGHAIVGRMLFGKLASQMHLNPGVELGSALGCDPDVDWTRFASEMENTYYIDMDYSGFDSTHSVGSFEALKVFLKELGYDTVALAYVDSLAISRHIYRDEIFTLEGGLPSGCACTSVFNTVLNNIIIRGLTDYLGYDVKMIAYGDDVIVSAPEPFDFGDYKRHLEQVTEYKITTANKDDLFAWHTSIEGVAFLKRRFVREGVLYKPVMSHAHLHNILSWARAGTIQDKVESVAQLAVHCSEVQYKNLFEPFAATGFKIPPYHTLKDMWYWKNGVA
nr:MAG: polyprotein [Tottorivirus sp.]